PFDGFVTSVIAEGGDEVFKGSIAVTVVDPQRFEALILVGENDIAQVTEETRAEVSIDSMSGVVLPAEVTSIAPTATIATGVVNYEVTVELASLEEIRAQLDEARGDSTSGKMTDKLKDAIEAGDITQDEAEAMMRKDGGGQEAMSASSIEDIGLREGLSVSVTLLIAQKTNVLLVPNAAIDIEGNQPFVTIVAEDGSEEQRWITTGVSNWQFTEVVEGLDEGEVIKTLGAIAAKDSDAEDRPAVMGMRGHP
ncbi:efflux RND transporter periplasmic adaptor subunit, partial [Chloroflexota bacterium]